MIAMVRVARAEFRRLASPTYLLSAVALPTFFAALTTWLTFDSASGGTVGGTPPGGKVVSTVTLAKETGFLEGVSQSFTFLGVIAVVLAAMSIATDYTQGTLRNLLVRQPSRWRVLGGKLVALAGLVSASAIAASLAGTVTAFAMASTTGVSTSAWNMAELAPRIFGLAAGLFGWASIGALLATVLRSVPAAIGIGIGWALPVEAIVGGAWKAGKSWFPGGVFEAIAAAGNDTLTLQRAVAVGSVYLVIAIAANLVLFTRREVTA